MKKIGLLVLFLSVFQLGFAQIEEEVDMGEEENVEAIEEQNEEVENEVVIKWEKSFAETKQKALKENKKILIFFTGSDWCSFCKALEEDVVNSDKFKEFSKSAVFYKADFPRAKDLVSKEQQKENKELKDKYYISTYPVFVIADKNGQMIAKKKSYNLMRDPEYHFMFLEKYLKK